VVGRCANPECGILFRYYRDGKLFRFELSAPSTALRVRSEAATRRRIEDFWLCGACASKMTLISEDGVGVRTRPLPRTPASLTVSIEEFSIRQAEA
jgi:hypothetical protein